MNIEDEIEEYKEKIIELKRNINCLKNSKKEYKSAYKITETKKLLKIYEIHLQNLLYKYQYDSYYKKRKEEDI